MYLLNMKKFSWKSQNVILISCQKITEHKIEEEVLFRKQVKNTQKLKELCRKISLNTHHYRIPRE